MKKGTFALFGFLALLMLRSAEPQTPAGPAISAPGNSRIQSNNGLQNFAKLPLLFIRNQGQVQGRAAYYVQGKDTTVFFSSDGITYALVDHSPHFDTPAQRWIVKLDFVASNPSVRPEGLELTPAVVSYFKGRPDQWHTGLPTYGRIVYRELWPGIDLVFSGTPDRLKYCLIVHPGADPGMIRLAYRGADSVSVDDKGRLVVTTPARIFHDAKPSAYQEIDGERREIPAAYDLAQNVAAEASARSYGFRLGPYDKTRALILDPAVLIYSGFIGGSGSEYGMSIAVDASKCAYIAGYTGSSEGTFPEAVGPDLTYAGGFDAFVAKVQPDGASLAYCGYIGGPADDQALGIAVNSAGQAFISGGTASSQAYFPVAVGPDLTFNSEGGLRDAFVAKVNASGTSLLYCGYIGGVADDAASRIAVDGNGNAYVTGATQSDELSFPVKTGPDITRNNAMDAFVAKVKADGTGLDYCGYIGGASGSSSGTGVAVDSAGCAYLTGSTTASQPGFPVTGGPDLTFNGGIDAYVAKVKADGSGFLYCGYIGGTGSEVGYGIAVDGAGAAYVAGDSTSDQTTFPVETGPDLTYNGGAKDAFVAKVEPDGSGLAFCGYIGGADNEGATGIGLFASAGLTSAIVSGWSNSSDATFPVLIGPNLDYSGLGDAFVAKVSALGTHLVYCGYIGGTGTDDGFGMAVDGAGDAYITGRTNSSSGFPIAMGPDLVHNGDYDAFVAKISAALLPPTLVAPSQGATNQPLSLNLEWQDTNSSPQEQGYEIRLKKTGGSYTYYTTAQDATTLAISGLALNATYLWNVRAMGDGTDFVDSPWANSGTDRSFKTIPKATLLAPTLASPLNGATGQPTTLTLQWLDTNTAPQEVKYKIRIKKAGGAYVNYTAAQNATSYVLSGLSSSTTYYWNVMAKGNGTTILNSAWANGGVDWTFQTAAPVKLTAPLLVAPANGATNQPLTVTLQWQDRNSAPQEVRHQIRIKPAGGSYSYFSAAQDATSFVRSNLARNKTYYWNVRAKGDAKGILDSAWASGGADWSFKTLQ